MCILCHFFVISHLGTTIGQILSTFLEIRDDLLNLMKVAHCSNGLERAQAFQCLAQCTLKCTIITIHTEPYH